MRFPRMFMALLATAVLVTAGCGHQSPVAPTNVKAPGAGDVAMHRTAGTTGAPIHFEGEIGPGALYSIDVPADWNGTLVLYAHGYTYPQEPVALPGGSYPGVRDELLGRGYAVAATSFSENGFAEAEGARQVHQLRGLFKSRVGAPGRTFLLGSSLGGLIAVDLLQTHAEQFAGALAVSSPLGGTMAEFDYVGDVRLLWDLFMCDLPGSFTETPNDPFPLDAIVNCIMTNPQKFGIIVSVWRQGGLRVEGNTPNELAMSVASSLGFHWVGFDDAMHRTHNHLPYDNHEAVYVSPVLPVSVVDGINANIARYTATPDAVNYLMHHYEPSGVLKKPLLTIHAERDRLVPCGHEDMLLAKVSAAGSLDNLSQSRYTSKYGHTEAFSAAEVAKAFDALVAWVDTGVKPTSPVSLGP